jgi:hypothetical protein
MYKPGYDRDTGDQISMFPSYILDSVEILHRRYKTVKRFVKASYPIIEITLEEKLHKVCFQIFYINDEYLEIQEPTYHYYSKISHYDFYRGERRFSRNKGRLFTVIADLKMCGLWELVKNKDFIKINEHNENTDKEILEKELSSIIGKNK